MKSPQATTAVCGFAASLFGVLVLICPWTNAAVGTMEVKQDNIKFTIKHHDDGRDKPYWVAFSAETGEVRSEYKFDRAGYVTNISVGPERYSMVYDLSSSAFQEARPRSTFARALNEVDQHQEDTNDEEDNLLARDSVRNSVAAAAKAQESLAVFQSPAPLFTCQECVEAWDAVCNEGVPSVCRVKDEEMEKFSANAAASVTTLCETLGSACSSSGGAAACAGQCDDRPDVNPCLDSSSDEYRCAFDASSKRPFSLDLNSCDFVDADAADLPGCFENFGKSNIQALYISFHDHLRTLPAGVFSGLTEVTDMDLSYVAIKYLPSGVFSGLNSVTKLSHHFSQLASLPVDIFDDTPELEDLVISSTALTSIPAGVLSGLKKLERLDMSQDSLQCIPQSTATELYWAEGLDSDSTCMCEPAVAISCGTGSCVPGKKGYTCE